MEEHNWEQLAGLCEDEGYVVDVREGGISEGGSQGACDGYQGEREYDAVVWEDGRGFCALRGVEAEVEVANGGCEEGLHCIEEDGEFEQFGGGRGAVWSGRQALLKKSPGETV